MDTSAKYRNIAVHPQVSFVVDDAIGEGASGMRFVEVRGRAEQVQVSPPAEEERLSGHIIRIHPRRVVSWNADPEHPGLQSQTLAATAGSGSPTQDGRPTLETNGLSADQAAAIVANLVAELQAGIDTHDAEVYDRHFVPTSSGAAPTAPPSVATTTSTASTPPYWDTVSAGRRHATRPFRPSPLSPDVVVAHVRRVALDSDDHTIEPDAGFSEMALYVLIRRGGHPWLAAEQNTPLRPTPGTSFTPAEAAADVSR
jgi:hypothetical protein